tara:strand:- start:523 stop:675 length:153 start_codon:yes stop_codon:yes gene_type:complete
MSSLLEWDVVHGTKNYVQEKDGKEALTLLKACCKACWCADTPPLPEASKE